VNLIDNIFTNSLSEGTKSGVLYSDMSDNFPIQQYSGMETKRAKHTKNMMQKRIMSKSNIAKCEYIFTSISWEYVYVENNGDLAYLKFLKVPMRFF